MGGCYYDIFPIYAYKYTITLLATEGKEVCHHEVCDLACRQANNEVCDLACIAKKQQNYMQTCHS